MAENTLVSGKTTHLGSVHSASGPGVMLLVVVALFVLTQLYLAIPLLTYVNQSFSPATPGRHVRNGHLFQPGLCWWVSALGAVIGSGQ